MINVNLLSNMFKVKYDALEAKMSNFNSRNSRYLFIMNIGKVLDTLYNIINKKQFIITKKERTRILVGLLNIIAHYRHYYFSHRKANNIIILFCDNQRQYVEYEELLNDLKTFIDFIPGIVFIPKVDFPKEINETKINNTFYYIHTVAHIIESVKKKSDVLNKKLIVNVLGNDPMEFQYLPIVENTLFINPFGSNKKVFDYVDLWEDMTCPDERFGSVIYELELKYLLLPYAMLYNKMSTNFPKKYKITSARSISIKNRLNILFKTIDESKGQPLSEIVLNYVKVTYLGEDAFKNIEQFKRRYFMFYYNMSKLIRPFINDLLKTWTKKIKNSNLHNLNEMVESFSTNNLNVDWLLEDKGDM